MKRERNFTTTVFEPLKSDTPEECGVGVEIHFDRNGPDINGDTLLLYLADDTTMEQAENLRDLLNGIVTRIAVSKPK